MNDDTCKLFERVAQKMGWFDKGLEETEEKVCALFISFTDCVTLQIYIYHILI